MLTGALWIFMAMFTYKGYTGADLINIIIDTLGTVGAICMNLLPLFMIICLIWFLTITYIFMAKRDGGNNGKNR